MVEGGCVDPQGHCVCPTVRKWPLLLGEGPSGVSTSESLLWATRVPRPHVSPWGSQADLTQALARDTGALPSPVQPAPLMSGGRRLPANTGHSELSEERAVSPRKALSSGHSCPRLPGHGSRGKLVSQALLYRPCMVQPPPLLLCLPGPPQPSVIPPTEPLTACPSQRMVRTGVPASHLLGSRPTLSASDHREALWGWALPHVTRVDTHCSDV